MGARYKPEEIRLLRTNIPSKSIAEQIGRTQNSVINKRTRLGVNIYKGVYAPEYLSDIEKECRIRKKAKELGIKIQ